MRVDVSSRTLQTTTGASPSTSRHELSLEHVNTRKSRHLAGKCLWSCYLSSSVLLCISRDQGLGLDTPQEQKVGLSVSVFKKS